MHDLIPHFSQYFGPVVMHEPVLMQMVDQVNQWDLAAHVQSVAAGDEAGPVRGASYQTTRDGIAVFAIDGPLTKYGSSLSSGPGTVDMRRSVRKASADSQVKGIMLRIESPGGMYAGTGDLADDILSAGSAKPVHAYIEDIGASGAYWLASQAHSISANPGALVGSIGTYRILMDSSEAAAKAGLKVRVVRAGEFKAAGEPGTEITDKQFANFQREVNEVNALFLSAVQGPRGFSDEQMQSLATGQVWVASEAQSKGLIDQVQTFDAAMDQLRSRIGSTATSTKETVMAKPNDNWNRFRVEDDDREEKMEDEEREEEANEEEEEDKTEDEERDDEAEGEKRKESTEDDKEKPATLAQLKSAFPKSTAEDREQMLMKGMSLTSAALYMCDLFSAKLENRERQDKRPGNKALPSGSGKAKSSATADAPTEWRRLINEKVQAGMPRQKAVLVVSRENPGLREAVVAAANSN